ncbi:MAG: hypothetical protein S4CHLAM102_03950 [Chlamydiia bacterium]|nr:hypothetical protein [Chlamydiia bacterium]
MALQTLTGLTAFGCTVIGSMCGRKALELHKHYTDTQETVKQPLDLELATSVYGALTCTKQYFGDEHPNFAPPKPILSRTTVYCSRHLGLRYVPTNAPPLVATILYGKRLESRVTIDHSHLSCKSRIVTVEGLEESIWDDPYVKETMERQAFCQDSTPLSIPDTARDTVVRELKFHKFESFGRGPLTLIGTITKVSGHHWQVSPPEGGKHFAVTEKSPEGYANFKKGERNSQMRNALGWIAAGLALGTLSAHLAYESEKEPPQEEGPPKNNLSPPYGGTFPLAR